MASLTTEQLIKIILGVFVFVAVFAGVYLVFKDKIFTFFNNLPTGGEPLNLFRSIL